MGLMGKSTGKSMLLMAKDRMEMPVRQPEVTVKQSHNGGYIVSKPHENYGPPKDMVFSKLSGVMKYMKECFKEEIDETDTKAKEKAEGE